MKKHFLGATYDLTQVNFQHVIQQLDEALLERDELVHTLHQVIEHGLPSAMYSEDTLEFKLREQIEAERARSQKLLEALESIKSTEPGPPWDEAFEEVFQKAREVLEAYNATQEPEHE